MLLTTRLPQNNTVPHAPVSGPTARSSETEPSKSSSACRFALYRNTGCPAPFSDSRHVATAASPAASAAARTAKPASRGPGGGGDGDGCAPPSAPPVFAVPGTVVAVVTCAAVIAADGGSVAQSQKAQSSGSVTPVSLHRTASSVHASAPATPPAAAQRTSGCLPNGRSNMPTGVHTNNRRRQRWAQLQNL
jgi:hypothetical protein